MRKTNSTAPDHDMVGITVRLDVPDNSVTKEKTVKKGKGKGKQPIRVEIISAEEADRAYDALLARMNHSELVEVCRLAGFRVDRSICASDLRQALRTGKDPSTHTSSVWKMRDQIQEYLDSHPHISINPKVCPRDCSQHPDLVVMQCYRSMGTLIAAAKSTNIKNAVQRKGAAIKQRAGLAKEKKGEGK